MAENTTANATVGAQVGGANNATENANEAGQNTNTDQQTVGKTYSQDEFESELERRVQQGINTAREKWSGELQSKLDEARNEGERLAKLTAAQREEETRKLEQEKFNAEREKYQRERLEFETTKQLGELGLPISFASILAGADADSTAENIKVFQTEWAKARQAIIDELTKGTPPPATGNTTAANTTDFMTVIHENQRL